MRNYFRYICICFFIFLFACGSKDNGAQLKLDSARQAYLKKDFIKAKQEIDSIKILYPRSFDEIRAGLALLDSVRRGENEQIIAHCDSFIEVNQPMVEEMKKLFSYQRNKQYQEAGVYIPRESLTSHIVGTTLRSGVEENGTLYLESVFVGNSQKHNQIRVATKDGSYAESLPVNDDGLNYRFSNMGKEYEVIKFAGKSENKVAEFIYTNIDKSITLTLNGRNKYSYTLSQTIKSAISKSYQLSTLMLQMDSLKTAKEKAEFHIYYLDNKTKETDTESTAN